MSERYRKVPAVALRGMTILPGIVAHFDVSRERSVKAIETAMMEDQTVFLITQKNIDKEEPEQTDLYTTGILAVIKQVIKLQNNVVRVLIEGEQRGRLLGISFQDFGPGGGRFSRGDPGGYAAGSSGDVWPLLPPESQAGKGIGKTCPGYAGFVQAFGLYWQ